MFRVPLPSGGFSTRLNQKAPLALRGLTAGLRLVRRVYGSLGACRLPWCGMGARARNGVVSQWRLRLPFRAEPRNLSGHAPPYTNVHPRDVYDCASGSAQHDNTTPRTAPRVHCPCMRALLCTLASRRCGNDGSHMNHGRQGVQTTQRAYVTVAPCCGIRKPPPLPEGASVSRCLWLEVTGPGCLGACSRASSPCRSTSWLLRRRCRAAASPTGSTGSRSCRPRARYFSGS